jgi:hypothetical protein
MIDNIHIVFLIILLVNLVLSLSLVFKSKENMKPPKPVRKVKSNQ